MVEPPGTAPGSDPLMTSAFMPIVRVAPDRVNIGARTARCKRMWFGGGAAERGGPVQGADPWGAASRGVRKKGAAVAILRARWWRGSRSPRALAGQKPALIFSNSSSIRSRIAGSSGVWASSVVSTGSRSAFFRSSSEISAMAASLVSA